MAAKFEHIFHVLTKNFLSQCGMPEVMPHVKHLYAPIGALLTKYPFKPIGAYKCFLNADVTDKIDTDREFALNNLNFCVPALTSFHAPRKLLWQVSLVVFSVKSIGKTTFKSTKINIFAKFLHRSSFWDSNLNLKGK